MRIVSGKNRGRQINPPRFFTDRPTTDRAKEGLFNILQNTYDFEQTRVLDLFAGSGNISLEFESRGCQAVTAIEKNPKYVDFIEKTAEKFHAQGFITALCADVLKFLPRATLHFDIIFADPPFDFERYDALPRMVFDNQSLSPEALLIVEHPQTIDFSADKYFLKSRRYGKVNFSFLSKKKN